MKRAAIIGAVAAVVGTFPVSALCALVYRFPIPFSGYASGPNAVLASMYAVMMYGVFLGGFVVLAVLGAVLGALVSRWSKGGASSENRARRDTILGLLGGVGADVIVVGLLANWDHIYGHW